MVSGAENRFRLAEIRVPKETLMRLASTAIAAFLMSTPSLAAEPPALSPASMRVIADIDARSGQISDLASKIWGYAEVGYKEKQSSALLQGALEAEGFSIERGVAGIPTAFIGEWGNGGPVIAVLAEFDALPGINQDATPTRSPIAGKAAGHACGHNLFGAGSVGAAIFTRPTLKGRRKGRLSDGAFLRFFGLPRGLQPPKAPFLIADWGA